MKRYIVIIFLIILSNSCKKDLTNETDIIKYSWKVKSIIIDNKKTKAPKKTYHGEKISNSNAYKLIFNNDSIFYLHASINNLQGKYKISKKGEISIDSIYSTYVCCDNDFDNNLISIISSIISYKVLGNTLILKGESGEVELKKD